LKILGIYSSRRRKGAEFMEATENWAAWNSALRLSDGDKSGAFGRLRSRIFIPSIGAWKHL